MNVLSNTSKVMFHRFGGGEGRGEEGEWRIKGMLKSSGFCVVSIRTVELGLVLSILVRG